jgi:hypothetical protein
MATPALAISHVPPAFTVTRLADGKFVTARAILSPYEFPVEGQPNSNLMRELRWYLEHFLDYPFEPEIAHSERVLDALRAWGTQAFQALFDHRDAGAWLADTEALQIHPSVFSIRPVSLSSSPRCWSSRCASKSSAIRKASGRSRSKRNLPATAPSSCW